MRPGISQSLGGGIWRPKPADTPSKNSPLVMMARFTMLPSSSAAFGASTGPATAFSCASTDAAAGLSVACVRAAAGICRSGAVPATALAVPPSAVDCIACGFAAVEGACRRCEANIEVSKADLVCSTRGQAKCNGLMISNADQAHTAPSTWLEDDNFCGVVSTPRATQESLILN